MAGLRTRVEGLVPSAPTRGLLAVAQVVDADLPDGWASGIAIDRRPCGCNEVWAPDCDSPEVKPGDEFPAGGDPIEFDSFTVIHPDACSSFGIGPLDHFKTRATQIYEAQEGYSIESEFWTGTLLPGNPHLASPDAVSAGEPEGIVQAIARLEDIIDCRAGVIHMTSAAAIWAARYNLISLSGQRMVTALGTPVAVGSGYPGTGPDGAEPPDDASWMYATGPLRIYRGPIDVLPEMASQALARSINRFVYRVERVVLVEWDLCLHVAQLAGHGPDIPEFVVS